MQNSLLKIIVLVFGSVFLYRYRFRLVNFILGQQWLRKIAVSMFMQVPFVRNRMVGQLLK